MVAIEHLEKFFTDHPDKVRDPEHVLRLAKWIANPGKFIGSRDAESLLGEPVAKELFGLMGQDTAYIKISFEQSLP